LSEAKVAQFIVASHSPILITLPGAEILSLDGPRLQRVDCWQTEHFQITKDFLNAPQRFYRHLLDEAPDEPEDE
jgi:predicted ATPase